MGGAQGVASTVGVMTSTGLRGTRTTVRGVLPCRQELGRVLAGFLDTSDRIRSPFVIGHRIGHITVIIFTSGADLYNKFGTGVVERLAIVLSRCGSLNVRGILLCPMNQGMTRNIGGLKFGTRNSFRRVTSGPSCRRTTTLTRSLVEHFLRHSVSGIRLLCGRFHSATMRILAHRACLPVSLARRGGRRSGNEVPSCVIRPSMSIIVKRLLPGMLHVGVFAMLLSSGTSRRTTHAVTVRVTASGTGSLLRSLAIVCGGDHRRTVAGRLLSVMNNSVT